MDDKENKQISDILSRLETLNAERSAFQYQWIDINRFVSPEQQYFYPAQLRQQGTKLNREIYDSTASQALPMYAAGLESIVTPRNQEWHTLSTNNMQLDNDPEIKLYFQQVTRILFSVRYSSHANFTSVSNEIYRSLGKYGTACLFIDDALSEGIVYKAIHISQFYISEDSTGHIDTVIRTFEYTARQALQAWGYDKLPDKIKDVLEKKPDQKFNFIHMVEPNQEYVSDDFDSNGKKFVSIYICKDTKTIMSKGGYNTMPYAVCRYATNTGEVYGRSPAMECLADIRMIQVAAKNDLNTRQLATQPPLLSDAKGFANSIKITPGSVLTGGLDGNGRPRLVPMNSGAQVNLSEDLIDRLRVNIQNSFSIPLFQMLAQTSTQMTATEVLLRNQEKAALLTPAAGRVQNELLGPMIEREIDILSRAGMLPPMPAGLRMTAGKYEAQYTGPLNQLQRSDEAIHMLNLVNNLGTIAQFNPDVTTLIDFEKMVRYLADIGNVPADIVKTPDQVAAIKQQQAQQQQLQQQLQAAPIAAQSAKDFASAQQMASQPSPGIPPR